MNVNNPLEISTHQFPTPLEAASRKTKKNKKLPPTTTSTQVVALPLLSQQAQPAAFTPSSRAVNLTPEIRLTPSGLANTPATLNTAISLEIEVQEEVGDRKQEMPSEHSTNHDHLLLTEKQHEFHEEFSPLLEHYPTTPQPNNLKKAGREHYERLMDQHLHQVAGFSAAVATKNALYDTVKLTLTGSPKSQSSFQAFRATDQTNYRALSQEHESLKAVFDQRMQVLLEAIDQKLLEKAYLDTAIIGVDGVLQSWLGIAYQYGAKHRLSDVKEGLNIRQDRLGLKGEEASISMTTLATAQANTPGNVLQEIAELSNRTAVLKEQTLLWHKTLYTVFAQLTSSELPKQYTRYYQQELDAVKKKTESLEPKRIELLQRLEKIIETEKGNPSSSEYLDAKQKHLELSKRWSQIQYRCRQTEQFIGQAQTYFAHLATPAEQTSSAGTPAFSKRFAEAAELVKNIVQLKEETVAGNDWELFFDRDTRLTLYAQAKSMHTQLAEQRTEFESKQLPKASTSLKTYELHLQTLKQYKKDIEAHLTQLSQAMSARAKWQLP